jgi:hypothetical protein
MKPEREKRTPTRQGSEVLLDPVNIRSQKFPNCIFLSLERGRHYPVGGHDRGQLKAVTEASCGQ